MTVRITAIKIDGERIPVDSIEHLCIESAARYRTEGELSHQISYSDVPCGPERWFFILKDGTRRTLERYPSDE